MSNQNADQVSRKVKDIVKECLGKDGEVQAADSFIEDLGADSLDIVEMVIAIEKEFNIEIPDEDAEKITTVQDAIDYILTNAR
ncbi:MAG TPA: acyl carrier protein [Myxococcota bacterium]|nr:acyl carrier protein [Myxococcota bacterium]HND28584.1 acyl carrier protein [Myxococcota bacterium]